MREDARVLKNWRKINCWAQIITRRSRYGFWWFVLNNRFFFNFLTPAHPHAQSLFLFPIVFGINIIGSAEALPILCVRYFWWEREREIQRKRDRRKWRHHCRAKIGDEFTLSLAKNSHNWRGAYIFPCQKFALFVSPFTFPVSSFTERSPLPWWRWNSQWVHTFHCQKNFRPQALFPLFQTSRATSDR